MNRRRVFLCCICAAAMGVSCARRPAPTPQVEGVEMRAIPVEMIPDGPAVEFPRQPLTTFGDTRLRHNNSIHSLAISADGKRLAVATNWDPVVTIWDVRAGREVRRITVPGAETGVRVLLKEGFGIQASVVGFTPDGARLVVRCGQNALVFNPDTGEKLVEIVGAARCGIVLSPDGQTLLGFPPTNHLTLWSTDTGKIVQNFGLVAATNCHGLCFSPNGKLVVAYMLRDRTGVLFTASADGSAALEIRYSVTAGATLTLSHGLRWPREDRVLICWDEYYISLDPTTWKEVARQSYRGEPMLLDPRNTAPGGRVFGKVMPEGRLVAVELDKFSLTPFVGLRASRFASPFPVVTADGTVIAIPDLHSVRLHELPSGKPLHPDIDSKPISSARVIGFTRDGQRFIASAYGDIRVWDTSTGEAQVLEKPPMGSVSFTPTVLQSPDGRWFAGADPEFWERMAVWDAETGKVAYREPARPHDEARDYAKKDGTGLLGFAPDGTLLVFHQLTGDIVRHELPSGKVVQTIPGMANTKAACLSPDGRRLAVSGQPFLAIRSTDPKDDWRVIERQPEPRHPFSGKPCPLPLAFSPDGRRLVTHSDEGELAVWDVTGTPTVLARRPGVREDKDIVQPRCVFTPDGRRILRATYIGGERFGIQVLEASTLGEEFQLSPPETWRRFELSPDTRRLLLAHADTTFTLWDWAAVRARVQRPETPAGAPERWARLASTSAKLGLACVETLVADPDAAMALLRDLGQPTEAIRVVRAVEVLERIGTPEARELLAEWAKVEGLLGEEAKAALSRMSKLRS